MKKNKTTKHLLYALFGIILLVILTKGITYAKYVSDAAFNYYLGSKGFYFESDDLSSTQNKITDTSWDGEKVTFNIKNSSNKYIASESDISYEITCSIEEENTTKECFLNGTDSNKITAKLSSSLGCLNETNDEVDTSSYTEENCSEYTWTYLPTSSDHYFEVVDKEGNEINNATVVITAKSTEPYEKTISAKYILTKDSSDIGSLSLKYETKTNYENVIITNSYNEDKCLKLTWNADDLLIDEDSNDYISYKTNDASYINEIIFKVSKKNSMNYVFYKTDTTKTYSETDFTLVETTECE